MKIGFKKMLYNVAAIVCASFAGMFGFLLGARLMMWIVLPQPWLGLTCLIVVMVGAAIGIIVVRFAFFGFGSKDE